MAISDEYVINAHRVDNQELSENRIGIIECKQRIPMRILCALSVVMAILVPPICLIFLLILMLRYIIVNVTK